MKSISRGEWRYALLLIPLLGLAAIATMSTVAHVEELIRGIESDRAYQRLEDHVALEQDKLKDLARYAAASVVATNADLDAHLERLLGERALQRLNLDAVAILGPDGSVLRVRFAPQHVAAEGDPVEYMSCTGIVSSLPRGKLSWAGFARVSSGPALLALAGMTGPDGETADMPIVALVRPFDEPFIKGIQQSYPDFIGLATPETIKDPSAQVVPIRDPSGRQIGAFLFRVDRELIEEAVSSVRLVVHALTLGFLFLAGALGLWAIRSTTEVERIRRVGRFVDAMDYLADGLVAVDKKGHVTGCNPSARVMAGHFPDHHEGVLDLFPMLSAENLAVLSDRDRPREVEVPVRSGPGKQVWRFRSQPSEDVNLLLISDVTDERSQEMRRRQVAALQMIGRVARGVAHDFNNILCAISGHAALLGLPADLDENDKASLRAITQESERGAALAGHLLELSRVRKQEEPADRLPDHVEKAASLLRVGLSPSWEVVLDMEKAFPAVTPSAIQVEQVVLNLGLLAADEMGIPGILKVAVHKPAARDPLLDVGDEFVAVVTVSAHQTGDSEGYRASEATRASAEEAGVIQSVVRTMLEEVGGRLDVLFTPTGRRFYRVCLPEFGGAPKGGSLRVPEEWANYLAQWKVLLALPDGQLLARLKGHLEGLGSTVETASDTVTALSKVDQDHAFTAMVFDEDLLGADAEAGGLLRAILKLQPWAGVVVVGQDRSVAPASLAEEIVFASKSADAEAVVNAMIQAREAVGKRRRPA